MLKRKPSPDRRGLGAPSDVVTLTFEPTMGQETVAAEDLRVVALISRSQ